VAIIPQGSGTCLADGSEHAREVQSKFVPIMGLLNKSQFSEDQSHLANAMNHHTPGAGSKRPIQQGHRGFGARSVHGVREDERREERQACEREADKGPTCLREAAPVKEGNAAGGLFNRPIITGS